MRSSVGKPRGSARIIVVKIERGSSQLERLNSHGGTHPQKRQNVSVWKALEKFNGAKHAIVTV